ncbi:Asp-tRNA(Asn)/Glu-tRNA(Gln) amidotransferase subunit GatC [bacterium]|nr:Asp-tRNA(Asn)/Glu-tRNA(Gln) amidotransferase subunit GatC [bacterium]
MSIDRKTVEHVAALARLGLTGEEKTKLEAELSGILDHVAQLSKLETGKVEPLYHILPIQNVFREDAASPAGVRDDVLKHAPGARPPFFVVPNVLDE